MTQLGSLERAVMDVLWSAGAAMSVHDLVEELHDREPAYTTVLTVVTNLHKKGSSVEKKSAAPTGTSPCRPVKRPPHAPCVRSSTPAGTPRQY